MYTSCKIASAVLVLSGALLPGRAPAAPLTDESAERAISSAQRIRKALEHTLSIDIDQQPLPLAINQLQEQTHLTFVLDRLTLAQNNIDPDQLVIRLKLKDMKVRNILRALLMPYNLSYVILGDTILISQEDAAVARQMRQRVNVSFDKVPFSQALRQLARETATNLVLDPRLARNAGAPVTLELEDVQLETAVRLMAEIVELRPVRVGNALFVTTRSSAAELHQESDTAAADEPAVRMPRAGLGGGGITVKTEVIKEEKVEKKETPKGKEEEKPEPAPPQAP